MRHLSLLLLTSCMLASCGPAGETMDVSKVLESMKGPTVQGMDATMLKMVDDAEAKGDYRASSQLLQQMMDKDPSNVAVKIRYGESLRRTGQAAKAVAIFNSIVSQEPTNQDALEGKGLAELSLAETDAASQTLTRVMSLNPNRWRTLNSIGVLFATRGMTNEAIQYMNAALKNNPNSPAVLNNKGLVAALDRDFTGALSSLSSASMNSKTSAQQIQADMNAALVYAISGDLPRAEQLARKHLQGAQLQNNLGQYALLANDEGLARTHLQMALSESKTFYEKAWNNLADLNQTSQTGQVGTEKRVGSISENSAAASGGTMSLPPISPDANTAPASNKAYYTPSQASQIQPSANAPQPNTNTKGDTNNASKNSDSRNGFEAFGDFITKW